MLFRNYLSCHSDTERSVVEESIRGAKSGFFATLRMTDVLEIEVDSRFRENYMDRDYSSFTPL